MNVSFMYGLLDKKTGYLIPKENYKSNKYAYCRVPNYFRKLAKEFPNTYEIVKLVPKEV